MNTFTNEEIATVISADNGVSLITQLLNGLNKQIEASHEVHDANDRAIAALEDMINAQSVAIDNRDKLIASQDRQIALLEQLSNI